MKISVLLEPIPTGFRASTGAPLNLTAEAPTFDLALAAIQGAVTAKLASGAKVVEVDVPSTNRLRELAAGLAQDKEILDQVHAAAMEYRRQREAEEDAAEADAEAEKSMHDANGSPMTPRQQEPAA